jgi:hypothetical protein
VSGARLADARGEKSREDGDVQDIAGVDEGARGRRRKLCKARDGLLRGDKGTVDVDGRVATEVGKGEGEGVVGGGEVPGADCDASVGRRRHRGGRGLTIVDDDTGDAEHLLHLGKGIDHIVGLGEVARDVQLVVGAVGLLQGAGGEGDLVALGGKGAGDGLADIGARAEDEDNGGFGGHDLMLGRLRISYLGVFRTWSCLKRGRS